MRRVFWGVLGIGIGAVIGVSVVRAVNRTKQRLSPPNLAREGIERSVALKDRMRDALDAGRAAMIQREAELRTDLKLDQ
ncbi:MAG: hypothetical protein NVSMB57_12390 [Actinomycetota bacterium]